MEMTIVTWPESQDLFGCANYREHSKLINGEVGLKIYGSSAYLVEKEWWEGDIDPIDEDEENDEGYNNELKECYDDELLRLGFLTEDDFDDDDDEEDDDDDEEDDIEL